MDDNKENKYIKSMSTLINNDTHDIHRMIMVIDNFCMICHKSVNYSCQKILLGMIWGWIVCNDCIKNGATKSEVINYISLHSVVPLMWLFDMSMITKVPNKEQDSGLKFFRFSKKHTDNPIYIGQLDWLNGLCALRYNIRYKTFCVDLCFYDEDSKLVHRCVSLKNIFKHNPTLYDRLITCNDLIKDTNIKISWNDLPRILCDSITLIYEEAKQADAFSFYL